MAAARGLCAAPRGWRIVAGRHRKAAKPDRQRVQISSLRDFQEVRCWLGARRHCHSAPKATGQPQGSVAQDDQANTRPESQMAGTWAYRSQFTGFVVGEYSVAWNANHELVVSEDPSRNGHKLSGVLRKTCDEWYSVELQHGFACRLRLEGHDRMASQFREEGGEWEPVMVAERSVPQSSGRRAAVLVVSLLASGICSGKIFGWSMGLGMVFLMFVHELGHALAMYAFGVPVGPMVFVPLMGAAVKMEAKPGSAWQEALIALAGPALGSVPTFACLLAVVAGCDPYLFLTLTKFGLLVNLGNLIPLGVLDGGRIAPTLSHWAMPFGFAASAGLAVLQPQPGVAAAFSAACAYRCWQPLDAIRKADRPELYFEGLTNMQRNVISSGYFGLAGVLFSAYYLNESIFQGLYGRKGQEEQ